MNMTIQKSEDEASRSEILIVDDNPGNLGVLTRILGDLYDVRVTVNGRLALAAVSSSPPDLVLLDIMMPELDGYEVCRQLKANSKSNNIPVIFMSALDDTLDKVKAFQVGGVDYVTKPFQIDEVLARVKTHLSIHQLQEKLEHQNAELLKKYEQIQHLQELTRGFLSGRAWDNIYSRIGREMFESERPERQGLSIFVSDIQGYSRMVEQTDPESLVNNMKYYLDLLTSIIYQNGGEVDKFLGDGILAMFPTPLQSVTAACQIQVGLSYVNLQRSGHQMSDFPTRIAITTGEVLLARIGSFDRQEYALIGDRVNIAAYLQKESPVGGLAIDDNTHTALSSLHSLTLSISATDKRICEPIYQITDCQLALDALKNEARE